LVSGDNLGRRLGVKFERWLAKV